MTSAELINKVKNLKLTKEQQQYVVAAILGLVGGVYGYWNYLLKPLSVDKLHWEKEVQVKEENLKKAREFKKNWSDFEARLARVQAGEQFVARRIVPSGSTDIMVQLAKLTLESGVVLSSYKPEDQTGAVMVGEGIFKNSAAIELRCNYHQLGGFLSRISGEETIYNVEDVQIEAIDISSDRNSMTIKTMMKLLTYTAGLTSGGAK